MHHTLDVHPIPNKPHLFINPHMYETKEQMEEQTKKQTKERMENKDIAEIFHKPLVLSN